MTMSSLKTPFLPLRGLVSGMGFLVVFLFLAEICRAQSLNVLQSTVVDSSALNFSAASANFSQNVNGRTFQRFPMATLHGYQYATYFDSNRNVCVGRRQLPSGGWEIIRFTDYSITSSDSHNVVAIGVCAADGTIHLLFDHHGHDMNYRVSAVGAATNPQGVVWSTSLFGPVTDQLGSVGKRTRVTYPSFFNAPNGNLMLYYRFGGSGNGDGMIYEYNGATHDWTTGMGKFISRAGTYSGTLSTNSTSRNPYINGISYAGNRLHASWGWRENSGGAQYNHDINYAYSDDDGRTWMNSAGSQIGVTSSSFIDVDSPGLLVAPIPQNIGLSNQYTHYAYPNGSCHVMVVHYESGTTTKRYHHYWRDAAGTWSSEVLPFSGTRPKIVGDDDGELYLVFADGQVLQVAKGTPNASETAWTWTIIHSESGRTEGGEGQLDYTRWETERVLSVYGQVAPPSDGSPTALSIFDYQVSPKAILPVPSHQQKEVAPSTSLEWTAGIDAVSHRVYLGTDANAVANATTASPEYQGEQSTTTYVPPAPFATSSTYYWRIDEVDGNAEVQQGLVWSFTTEGLPTISNISDQIIPLNTATPALPFTITGGASLAVVGSSSNPLLVPEMNIVQDGTGSNRTVTVTPAANETGVAEITLSVSNGYGTVNTEFQVTVNDPGTPVVTLVTLGTPIYLTEPTAWSDGLAAHSGATYIVPATGNLRSENGDSVFPGNSLIIRAGGKFQVRSNENTGGVTLVNDLILNGGSSFLTGDYVDLTAGTGVSITNVLEGVVTNTGYTRFRTYGSTGSGPITRSLKVLSRIDGNGRILASENSAEGLSSVTITNPANTFSGTWEVDAGSTLIFTDPGAVGAADIEVVDGGRLEIAGNWEPFGALTVADTPATQIDLDINHWTVSSLVIGGLSVGEGIYTASQLNALGSNAVFLGSGSVTVDALSELESWRLLYYGTINNTGTAADTNDANGDDEDNLLEFATGQDPHASTTVATPPAMNGANLEFIYPRSIAAMADGVSFQVEWSDTLQPASWSSSGVSEQILSDNGIVQEVKATLPAGSGASRFVHLKATLP